MQKFIPYEKLSKKKKRELDTRRRTVWTISPVTRKPASPKAYNRKKAQKWRDDSGFCAFDLDGIYGVECKSASISLRSGMERSAPFFVATR